MNFGGFVFGRSVVVKQNRVATVLTREEMNPITNPTKLIVLRQREQDLPIEKQITLIRLNGDFALPKRAGREVSPPFRSPEP